MPALPHGVRVVPHAWIVLADGTRLAARLWLPETDAPVPAILEYLPYRKGDALAVRDHGHAAWFAGHGYAFARVDVRGTGDSDGLIADEYTAQELADGAEIVAWLAARPWCSGAVGMFGNSWGGFNGLQVAALRPPALRAVVSCHSTDDRYADDVHVYGGCLLAVEMLSWATWMLPMNALPPDPRVVGEGWRETWRARIAGTPPFAHAWIAHARRDAYWRHGSVCEDPAAIACPVLMVGGLADGYRNAVPRFLAAAGGPHRGIVGPWAHGYPHATGPGPGIGFLTACLRWWDRWLRDEENGVDADAVLRLWLEEPVRAGDPVAERPGRFLAEPAWPSPHVEPLRLHLGRGTLAAAAGAAAALVHRPAQHHGMAAGSWCPHGAAVDFPPDQRAEDALCLVFDSAPLAARLELAGRPRLRLELAVDRPVALVAARLCAVGPDGVSTLLTRGALNLTHRHGHDRVDALVPGERYAVELELDLLSRAVAAGDRLRLALSTAYWPWLWPPPEPVVLTVHAGAASWLELPVHVGACAPAAGLGTPEETPRPPGTSVPAAEPRWRVTRDLATRTWLVSENQLGGERVALDDGTVVEMVLENRFAIREDEPLSARVECDRRFALRYPGGPELRVETRSSMHADAAAFHLRDALEAFEGDRRVAARTWARAIRRDGV